MSSAQTMKIYSIISRIEEELEESPRTKFAGSTNKRIVEIERLFDLISDLKVTIPEDIRRATGILAEAENTVNDAKENAKEILDSAKAEAEQMLQNAQVSAENIYKQAQTEFETKVSEAEIYKEALKRANSISVEAETNANAIYNGARRYADEILADLQSYISDYHKMISDNRKELGIVKNENIPSPLPIESAREFNDSFAEPHSQPVEKKTIEKKANDFVQIKETDREMDDFEDEDLIVSKPQKSKKKTAKKAIIEDDFEDDFEEEEEEKPKKKGIFSRMFEVEDDEDDDYDDDDFEDDDDFVPVKKQKAKKKKK